MLCEFDLFPFHRRTENQVVTTLQVKDGPTSRHRMTVGRAGKGLRLSVVSSCIGWSRRWFQLELRLRHVASQAYVLFTYDLRTVLGGLERKLVQCEVDS